MRGVSSRLFTVKNVTSCSPRSGCRYECAFIFLVVGVLAQQTFADDPEQIVGGTPAAPGEFPHQASLRVNGNHICGGSIIGRNKILTAAHCVDGIVYPPYNNLRIATGTIQINGGKLHTVSKVAVHPQYSGRREDAWRNDVAVITVGRRSDSSATVICLYNPSAGQTATLSGWGRTSTGGSLARSLLKMNQAVVSQNQCQQYHRGMPLTGSHLCTLNRFGIGACQGDSGGPLISNGVQIGITSWVLPCAQGVPDVYTNVYHHRNFIKSS